MSSLARSGSNITVETRKIKTKLSKIALRKGSLSEWPSFMVGLQPVQGDVLRNAYSIFVFELL